MSYVDNNLIPNEHVIKRGSVHWFLYLNGVIILIVAALIAYFVNFPIVFVIGACAGILMLLNAWIRIISTELAITNKRVIAKFGFIRRSTIELLHRNVESIHVEQSIPGRVLNFGSLTIRGTGGINALIPSIRAPLEFRRQAQAAIDAATQPQNGTS